MATARACLRQVHPELAEEAVGADRGLVDRDQALHVAPGRVQEGALAEQVAGRVAPDVAGVRGQVEQLLVRRRTRSRPARPTRRRPRAGCRRASGRAARRAGRAPSAAWRPRPIVAWRCWKAITPGGRSWMDATARLAPRPEDDLERAAEEGLAGRSRPRRRRLGGPTPTSSSTSDGLGALAEADERPRDEGATGSADRPADEDGSFEPDAGRDDAAGRPGSRSPAASWASLSSAGQRSSRPRGRRAGRPDRARGPRRTSRGSPRPSLASAREGQRRDAVLAQLDDARGAVRDRVPRRPGAPAAVRTYGRTSIRSAARRSTYGV